MSEFKYNFELVILRTQYSSEHDRGRWQIKMRVGVDCNEKMDANNHPKKIKIIKSYLIITATSNMTRKKNKKSRKKRSETGALLCVQCVQAKKSNGIFAINVYILIFVK